jgi:hypothetical protein
MLPLFRLVLFFFAGTIGVYNLYNLRKITDNAYLTEDGFVDVGQVPNFYVLVEMVVYGYRMLFSFLVMLRLVQVPTRAPTAEQQDVDDGHIWSTFMAILMVTLGTNTDRSLGFDLHRGGDGEDPAAHGFNFSTNVAHTVASVTFASSRLVCLFWGITQVVVNLSSPGTWNYDKAIPWHRWLVGYMDISVFALGVIYTCIDVYRMHPSSLDIKDETVLDFLDSWTLEFYIGQAAELALGLVGMVVTFYAYFMYDSKVGGKTAVSLSQGFRVVALGLYTSASATWHAHNMEVYRGETGVTLYAATPLAYFLVVSGISVLYKLFCCNIVVALRDAAYTGELVMVRLFHTSGAVLFWRMGHSLCMFAFVHALFLATSEWIHVDIRPGTAISNVEHVVFKVEEDILAGGRAAFNVLKAMDPCRWSIDKNDPTTQLNEDITYGYDMEGINRTRSFNLKDHDAASKIDCRCKEGRQCDCDLMHAIRDNLTVTRGHKDRFIQNSAVGEIDHMDSLDHFTDDKAYDEALRHCHSIECDIVLGAAIAAETALLGSDFLFIFGPLEGAVADAAWFAQQANRIGHNIIKFGMRLAKTVKGLVVRVRRMGPMIETFKFLSKLETVVHFSPDVGQLVVLLPIVAQGLFSIMVAMFKRDNINTVAGEVGIILRVYVPLVLVSWVTVALIFTVPPIVERVVKEIPPSIVRSTIKETHSMALMKYAYVVNAVGSSFVLLGAILTALGKLRRVGNRILRLAREPANYIYRKFVGPGRRGRAGWVDTRASPGYVGPPLRPRGGRWVDPGWFQAFVISAATWALLAISLSEGYHLIKFYYGPTDMFIGTLSSLRAHATVHEHSGDVAQVSREGLCGLIGEGVKVAIKEGVKELEAVFGALEVTLGHFLGAIEEFLGLTSLVDTLGRIPMDSIFDGGWRAVEIMLALGVPLANTLIFGYVALAKAYYDNKGRPEDGEELASFCFTLAELLLYYNVGMLIMVHQVYNMLSTADFKIFHVGLNMGHLFPMGAIAILLNGLSMVGIVVTNLYPLK